MHGVDAQDIENHKWSKIKGWEEKRRDEEIKVSQ